MMSHLQVHLQFYVLKTILNKNKNDNNKKIYLEWAKFLKTKNNRMQQNVFGLQKCSTFKVNILIVMIFIFD
jgi:hypothetical protein